MSQPGEQLLLERARAGEPEAMGQLLSQHQDRLYNICLRMVANRDDAAELTQDVLLQIIEKLPEFRGDAQPGTWMTRIAINRCISFIRKQKHRNHASLQALNGHDRDQPTPQAHMPDSREPSPLQRVQDQESLALLQQAIARLEPDFRAVLVLRDIDGQDYQQIGKALDLAVGTVKSRLFRARLALRQHIQEHEQPQATSDVEPTRSRSHDPDPP